MKRAHPLLIECSEEELTKPTQSSLLNHVAMRPTQAPVSDATSKKITGFLSDWFVGNFRPLSIVVDVGFRALISRLSPSYTVPCRQRIMEVIGERHTTGLEILTNRLKKSNSLLVDYGCLDFESCAVVQYYNTVPIHFINDSWELESVVF